MKTLLFPKVLSLSLFLAFGISFGSCASNHTSDPLVKQSSSGICHDKSSGSFNRTKNYIPFIPLPPVSMLVDVYQRVKLIR
jgi:hypothetical protein